MLLIHQSGSVKVGQVVRYTLTYTPSNDRILPTPSHLHLKVKNTSAIALRAAWVHGPYSLYAAAYPSTFNPHKKTEDERLEGAPEYEPMLKAAGSWTTKLLVPEDCRETGADLGKHRHSLGSREDGSKDERASVTWIVEIASQVLFSNTANVHFELLVGRDERSLELGFAAVSGHGHGGPGQIKDHKSDTQKKRTGAHSHQQTAGVYSKAVRLVVEDTEALWDKPELPRWSDEHRTEIEREREAKVAAETRRSHDGKDRDAGASSDKSKDASSDKSKDASATLSNSTAQAGPEGKNSNNNSKKTNRRRRNVHLVILTHGLHSNVGADMLYLKESIDATVAQARMEAKKRRDSLREKEAQSKRTNGSTGTHSIPEEGSIETEKPATAPLSGGQEELNNAPDEDDDEEQTIVRGFHGNAVRTENGIQYLGKRLAKYILRFTYPDQPYVPVKKTGITRAVTNTFKSDAGKDKKDGKAVHPNSDVHLTTHDPEELPYKFTSISFIGHSLGGLIQTYAVAYIHKHSPEFFKQIQPINFVCMASPMLGLSNENPLYVRFALDFGLVGRTGRDLGLNWRTPTFGRSSWNAMIGGLGGGKKENKDTQVDPTSKPLLRILPTGPAHQVLKLFRNRTVYSNVVNDGIVPLRTSCLLFLDWRALGKIEKARRDNGIVGTVAEWGWAELTGQNTAHTAERIAAERFGNEDESDHDHSQTRRAEEGGHAVPQPDRDETAMDSARLTTRSSFHDSRVEGAAESPSKPQKGAFESFLDFFRPASGDSSTPSSPQRSSKASKAFRRAQTLKRDEGEVENPDDGGKTRNPTMRPHRPHLPNVLSENAPRPRATRGESEGEVQAPPRTSILESAGDILHPPLPSQRWITDPSSRARSIFHDRVYHPEDIPPPPVKRTTSRRNLAVQGNELQRNDSTTQSIASVESTVESGTMKVEEKIARAYHRDLSWRKVLVRLEPDAHNNMVVRRMFANAYGWPVVKHLCDTHFGDSVAAKMRDDDEFGAERAQSTTKPVDSSAGEEVKGQTVKQRSKRTVSEVQESRDEVKDLQVSQDGAASSYSSNIPLSESTSRVSISRQGSAVWDDAVFEGTDDDESDVDDRHFISRLMNPLSSRSSPEPGASHLISPPQQIRGSGSSLSQESFPLLSPGSNGAPARAHKSTFDASNVEGPILANTLVHEPEHMDEQAPGTVSVGLGKSAREEVKRSSVDGSLKAQTRNAQQK